MGIITKMRKQDAVYWEPTGARDRNGDPTFEDPVDIKCRWEDVHELFLDEQGNEVISNAKVYVDRVVKLRGILKKGTVYELDSNSPFENTGAYVIRKFEELPNLRNTEVLYTAML